MSAATVSTRLVDTTGRIEVHLAGCGHRAPRDPRALVVEQDFETCSTLRRLFDECESYGTQQVVMPCVRRYIGRTVSVEIDWADEGTGWRGSEPPVDPRTLATADVAVRLIAERGVGGGWPTYRVRGPAWAVERWLAENYDADYEPDYSKENDR